MRLAVLFAVLCALLAGAHGARHHSRWQAQRMRRAVESVVSDGRRADWSGVHRSLLFYSHALRRVQHSCRLSRTRCERRALHSFRR